MGIPFMDFETCLYKYIINYSELDMVLHCVVQPDHSFT